MTVFQIFIFFIFIFFIDYLFYRKSFSDSVQMLMINGFILIHGYILLGTLMTIKGENTKTTITHTYIQFGCYNFISNVLDNF